MFKVNEFYKEEKLSSTPISDKFKITSNCSKYSFTIHQSETKIHQVEFEWITKKQKMSPLNNQILKAIIDHFGDDIIGKQFKGFMEIKRNDVIYRADPNYRNTGCWFDNVLISWDYSYEIKNVPAELKMIF